MPLLPRPVSPLAHFAFAAVPLSFASLAYGQSGSRDQQPGAKPVAVVELFTSQGCSSCPPADKLLATIDQTARGQQLPVYVLSMHVDYWNSLGWADPYSSKAFTERQRRYAAAARSTRIYTPQMVVSGRAEFVGSNSRQAGSTLNAALKRPAEATVQLAVSPEATGDAWQVRYTATGAASADAIVLCLVADAEAIDVERGENRGRQLAHAGVVRALVERPLSGSPTGEARIAWPATQPRGDKPVGVVAFVQDPTSMAIKGAARWQAAN
ncbi:MAG: DUF1223 domain-containing protein [Planctomycetota bacterium]